MKRPLWPTWDDLQVEQMERWNSLPKKIKLEFIRDWYEFVLEILKSSKKLNSD